MYFILQLDCPANLAHFLLYLPPVFNPVSYLLWGPSDNQFLSLSDNYSPQSSKLMLLFFLDS